MLLSEEERREKIRGEISPPPLTHASVRAESEEGSEREEEKKRKKREVRRREKTGRESEREE